MFNGYNGDVPPWPVLSVVEEPETGLVQFAIPNRLGKFTPGGPWIFVQAPQYHWHRVAVASTDTKAWDHLVALEQKVFAFGQQTEEQETELLAQIA